MSDEPEWVADLQRQIAGLNARDRTRYQLIDPVRVFQPDQFVPLEGGRLDVGAWCADKASAERLVEEWRAKIEERGGSLRVCYPVTGWRRWWWRARHPIQWLRP